MMMSARVDMPALVAANKAMVLDTPGAGMPSAEFHHMLKELPDEGL
jgi:ABC-type branched-subunit amino acid transport system ATPase component